MITDGAPMAPGFYLMDCMNAMKQFPDGFFDLAVVDPPYGMNVTGRHKSPVLVGGRQTVRRARKAHVLP